MKNKLFTVLTTYQRYDFEGSTFWMKDIAHIYKSHGTVFKISIN